MFAVAVAPHLISGVHAWATAVIAALATIALALAIWATSDGRELGPEPLGAVLAIVVLVTALHALPLPSSLVAWLSPEAYAHATETARGLDFDAPRWIPYSRDPGGTWERVLFAIAVLAAFCGARIVTLSWKGTPLLASVALSALLVAMSHLGHRLVGAERVYGLYTPTYTQAYGPVLNPNNLAGLLALGLPICLGQGVRRRGAESWAWLVAGGTLAATGLLAGSRGGLVVLVGGPVLFGLAYARRQLSAARGDAPSRSRPSGRRGLVDAGLIVAALLGAGFGLAALAADDFLDMDYRDLTKFQLFGMQLSALEQDARMALMGAGRGAFRVALSPVIREPVRVMHAECLPLQYAVEFGIPIATVVLGAAAWRVFVALLRWQSPVQLGGLAGLAAIALQNLIDFSLELSGIAVPAAVCLGASLPRPNPKGRLRPRWELLRISRLSLVVCLPLVLLLSHAAARQDVLRLETKLNEYLQSRDSDAFWALYRGVALAHPADAGLVSLAALEGVLEDSTSAPFWLNRAMRLAPAWGKPHLWAAHWLGRRGHWEQAAGELSATGELDPKILLAELCAWLHAKPTSAFALSIAPPAGPARVDALDRAAECLSNYNHDESRAVDDVLLHEQPDHAFARLRAARRSMVVGDYQSAMTQAQEVRKKVPRLAAAVEAEAVAVAALGMQERAVEILESALGRTDNQREILLALATMHARARNAKAMRDTIDQLRVQSAGTSKGLAEVMAHLSECETILGNGARAWKAMLEAHRLTGYPQYLAAAAKLASEVGQLEFAVRAWEQLCAEQPENRGRCEMRDRARKAVEQSEAKDPGGGADQNYVRER